MADEQPNLFQVLIVLRRVGTKPDGPQGAFRHGSHERVIVAEGLTQGRVALLEAAGNAQGQNSGSRAATLGDEVRTRPSVPSVYRAVTWSRN